MAISCTTKCLLQVGTITTPSRDEKNQRPERRGNDVILTPVQYCLPRRGHLNSCKMSCGECQMLWEHRGKRNSAQAGSANCREDKSM